MFSQIYAQRKGEESSQMRTIRYKGRGEGGGGGGGGGGQGCICTQKTFFWTTKSQNISFFFVQAITLPFIIVYRKA